LPCSVVASPRTRRSVVDGLVALVEQRERRVDDLVRRDDFGWEDGGVDLAGVAHEELERSRTVENLLKVVLHANEGRDTDDIRDGRGEKRLGGSCDVFRHRAVDDNLSEKLLRDDLHELDTNAVIDEVLRHERLDESGVLVDDRLCVT